MKTLFVANAGGHLEELWQLGPRLPNARQPRAWVTWKSPQSDSLLAGEECIYLDKSEPRDIGATLRYARQARVILDADDWSEVYSTGSIMALPFFALARSRGIPCHFIESAARTQGPSLTGRLIEGVPGVNRYCQHESWSSRRNWRFGGSVFDSFAAAPSESFGETTIRRVVVSVGTNSFNFSRLLEAVKGIVPPEAEILWQTGNSDVSNLEIEAVPFLSSEDLSAAMTKADLVVTHAGVGSALAAMQAGHTPLLVPRRKRFGEHIDDHQVQIARHLVHRGVAVACDASQLNPAIAAIAASRRVEPVEPLAFDRAPPTPASATVRRLSLRLPIA